MLGVGAHERKLVPLGLLRKRYGSVLSRHVDRGCYASCVDCVDVCPSGSLCGVRLTDLVLCTFFRFAGASSSSICQFLNSLEHIAGATQALSSCIFHGGPAAMAMGSAVGDRHATVVDL